MTQNRSFQQVRTGIKRALYADYFTESETSARIDALVAQLQLKDASTAAGGSGHEPGLRSTERNATPARDESRRSRLTDDAVRRELVRYLNVLGDYLPEWFCRAVKWLRKPERFWARLFVSLVLMAGGVFSFLPVLGLWMLPLGLIIISQDLVFLQRPLVRAFHWIERKWHRWR
jgi:hypothetical protein